MAQSNVQRPVLKPALESLVAEQERWALDFGRWTEVPALQRNSRKCETNCSSLADLTL